MSTAVNFLQHRKNVESVPIFLVEWRWMSMLNEESAQSLKTNEILVLINVLKLLEQSSDLDDAKKKIKEIIKKREHE
jgi:hypothetical protein